MPLYCDMLVSGYFMIVPRAPEQLLVIFLIIVLDYSLQCHIEIDSDIYYDTR